MLRESEVFVYYFDVRVLLCCRWEFFVESRAESTRDTYNYGQYLNQFPANTIKVMREFERIQKRICRHKMSIMFHWNLQNIIYIYIFKRWFYLLLNYLSMSWNISFKMKPLSGQYYHVKLKILYYYKNNNYFSFMCLFEYAHAHRHTYSHTRICIHTYAHMHALLPSTVWQKEGRHLQADHLNVFRFICLMAYQPLRDI